MNKQRKRIGLAFAILLAACVRAPSISPAEAEAVHAAARKLLEYTAAAPMKSGPLPSEIGRLKLKSVRIMSDGVYMQTSSSFAQEAGLFVPRDPAAFIPVAGSDPEYRHIHGDVFSYRIRG